MTDPASTVDSSPAPTAPTGPRPKVTNRGRTAFAVASSNSDSTEVPEFEPFIAPGPRGFPPMTEFLDILEVDMVSKFEEINKQEHRTEFYDSNFLIVRRGQEFQDRKSRWPGRITNTSDSVLTIGITPLANCIVGKYHMYVAVMTPFGIRRTKKESTRDLYILFNPWSPADDVFLDDEPERQECVINETGIIYHGAYDDVAERHWNYGQFNYGVLDACLYIMDRSEMPITNRGDPIKVTRKASAMLNSRDDDGVLVGNWSGDYTYGVAPTSWTGSTEILLTYASSKTPVGYAQCWVYAAVFNTFLRCLGIPSRVVTNYYSAHDNDGNLKTDIILHENGKIDRTRTRDSIWNYHCWNECFMTRPDLPAGFGGWQVVDATPQETSDGLYRCGPASVLAIKHGELCYPFDAGFVFAEVSHPPTHPVCVTVLDNREGSDQTPPSVHPQVNSDVVFYSRGKDGAMQPVRVNQTHVGRMVLTKAAGDTTRRDITSQYKFPEGTSEERTVLEKAEGFGCHREKSRPLEADVDLVLPTLEVAIGDDFELSLGFKNRSDQQRVVEAYISGNVVYYTGVSSAEFMLREPTVTLKPNESVNELVVVESKKYMKHLVEQASLHFIVTGKVKETGQILTAMKVVRLHNPKLSVKVCTRPFPQLPSVSGANRVSEEMMVMVEFINPFSFALAEVYIRMEGAGVMMPKFKYYSLIPKGSSLIWTEFFVPKRAGTTRVFATLDCPKLRQVQGEASLTIEP
ncbi:unnamed protein product, partial [Tetraodon nigroviridis]